MAQSTLVLLTDFGSRDTYVGVMKGVIAGIAPPEARIIDLTHEIRPQDVRHAAYSLQIAVPYFPVDTIFVAVVDPGVGSTRRPVALDAGEHFFVAPDNGLLTPVIREMPIRGAVELVESRFQLPKISTTFHGRDIFAPAGAHLAAGIPLAALGPAIDPASLVTLPAPRRSKDSDGTWYGEVMHVDHFGNMITTLRESDLSVESGAAEGAEAGWRFAVGPSVIRGLSRTFADVGEGEPVAYIGSDGFLELAIRNRHAAQTLNGGVGADIRAWRESGRE